MSDLELEDLPTSHWSSWQVAALIFVTGLSLFNFSYSASNIGGILLYLDSAHSDCSHEAICLHSSLWKGLLVSSCLVGAFFGALFAGPLADHFGRRATLLTNNWFFILGSLSCAWSPGIVSLVISRCVVGLGVGAASALVHVYIGEVVPASRRGEHGAILAMMGTGGILVANLVCWAVPHWRWVFAFGCLPALLQVICGRTMPESNRNQPEAKYLARRSFEVVCMEGTDCMDCEDPEVEEAVLESTASWANLWQSMRSGEALLPLGIGCGLHILAQATGINVIIYYGPKMFSLAGFPSSTAICLSAGISACQMISTLLLSRLVDKVGRKPMSYIGLVFMTMSLLGIASSFLLPASHLAGWIALISCFCFRVAFSVSWGPLPYIITAEIFPEDIRAPGVSLCLAVKWVANFTIALTWLPLSECMTLAGTFALYAAICVLAFFFLTFYVPETSGKPLSQVTKVWNKFQDESPWALQSANHEWKTAVCQIPQIHVVAQQCIPFTFRSVLVEWDQFF